MDLVEPFLFLELLLEVEILEMTMDLVLTMSKYSMLPLPLVLNALK